MVNEESGVFHQTHLPTLIFLTAFGSRVRDTETVRLQCVCFFAVWLGPKILFIC